MNSRMRLITALQHQEPDRVPIDLDSMAASGISAIAYNELKTWLGEPHTPTRLWAPHELLAIPSEAILDAFHVDTRPVRLPIPGLDLAAPAWKPWALPDGSAAEIPAGFEPVQNGQGDWLIFEGAQPVFKLPAGGFYFDRLHYPLAGAISVAEIEKFPLPAFSSAQLAWMAAEARRLYTTSDKAIVCRFRGSLVEMACELRGWQQFMLDLAAEPRLAEALVARLAAHYLEILPAYLQAVGPYAQVIVLGDDLGDQNATLFSPKTYRRIFKPYHRQIVQTIKAHSQAAVFLHSDGAIRTLIPDLIEIGIDILNPIQISARNMHPRELKQEFGRELVFWGGGADTQHVLPFATPDEVRRHVGELIEIFAPGGGFIFNQIHNIQANVPAANIVAMFAAAYEFGFY